LNASFFIVALTVKLYLPLSNKARIGGVSGTKEHPTDITIMSFALKQEFCGAGVITGGLSVLIVENTTTGLTLS
jgi:hypothetical protein